MKDLVCFMLTLDLPKEGARISKLKTFLQHDLKNDFHRVCFLIWQNNKANVGLRVDSKKEKSMTSEHPPTARPQVMLRKHLLLDKAPAGTRTHTHSYTMTWYKEGREMVLQASDSPLLVTLPSSSQLLLAAGRGSESGRLAVGRS